MHFKVSISSEEILMILKQMTLPEYLADLAKLNVNKVGNSVAPHKAVLLLAISDLIETGVISTPLIPLDDCLIRAFSARWKQHVPIYSRFNCNLSYPFYHLASSGFWELIPLKSPERKIMKEYSSLKSLKKSFVGANIDEDLFRFFSDSDSREVIRSLLIAHYLKEDPSLPFSIASDLMPLFLLAISIS